MNPTLLSHWETLVSAHPTATALIEAEPSRIYSRLEVDAAANDWAQTHRDTDLKRRTVGFSESNGLGWLRVFLGLLKLDAVAAPFDPGDPTTSRQTTAANICASYLWQPERGLHSITDHRSLPGRHRDSRRLVKLTSGSTGNPRPLPFTDLEMLADGQNICSAMGIRPDDINLGLIPWGHSYGLGNLIVPLLSQGTPIVAGVSPLPHAIAAACEQWKPTVFPAVPAILESLVESGATKTQLQSLRTVITAGAPISNEVAEKFYGQFGHKVHNFYGSSETGGIAYDPTGERAMSGEGIGPPLPMVELAFGLHRRFVVSSPAVYSVGNRRPGYHRMPDLAHLAADGVLVLEGRTGRFVKIAGRRLNLVEVERMMTQLTEVKIRSALVLPHPTRKDALAAAIVSDHSAAEVRAALRNHLASWKIPKKVIILSNLPLTLRGKTDTRALQNLFA